MSTSIYALLNLSILLILGWVLLPTLDSRPIQTIMCFSLITIGLVVDTYSYYKSKYP
jgi:energy-converting hydrogenase Eha subunit C